MGRPPKGGFSVLRRKLNMKATIWKFILIAILMATLTGCASRPVTITTSPNVCRALYGDNPITWPSGLGSGVCGQVRRALDNGQPVYWNDRLFATPTPNH